VKLLEFLNGEAEADTAWRFRFSQRLNGAFGGTNGGVIAAAALAVARHAAPGRVPAALDARFLRGLGSGTSRIIPSVLHEGRTLSCVSLDVIDERGRLCTRATVSLVAADALERIDASGDAAPRPDRRTHAEGRPWPRPAPPIEIPLLESFDPRAVGRDERGSATSLRIPFDEAGRLAEAACIAADIAVGPPVGRALAGRAAIPHPNPDLSLRFAGDGDPPAELVGCGRLEQITRGLAQTRIEVWSGETLCAIGVSSSTLLAGAWPGAAPAKG
jgi:acyl-coenzyme A thioesterase PaaI-like protein